MKYLLIALIYIIGIAIKLTIVVLFMILIGWFLCDIDPDKTYTWYSGIWHGLFFIPNLIRSWFTDALYKAETYTTAYNILWWVFAVGPLCSFIFGANNRR